MVSSVGGDHPISDISETTRGERILVCSTYKVVLETPINVALGPTHSHHFTINALLPLFISQ